MCAATCAKGITNPSLVLGPAACERYHKLPDASFTRSPLVKGMAVSGPNRGSWHHREPERRSRWPGRRHGLGRVDGAGGAGGAGGHGGDRGPRRPGLGTAGTTATEWPATVGSDAWGAGGHGSVSWARGRPWRGGLLGRGRPRRRGAAPASPSSCPGPAPGGRIARSGVQRRLRRGRGGRRPIRRAQTARWRPGPRGGPAAGGPRRAGRRGVRPRRRALCGVQARRSARRGVRPRGRARRGAAGVRSGGRCRGRRRAAVPGGVRAGGGLGGGPRPRAQPWHRHEQQRQHRAHGDDGQHDQGGPDDRQPYHAAREKGRPQIHDQDAGPVRVADVEHAVMQVLAVGRERRHALPGPADHRHEQVRVGDEHDRGRQQQGQDRAEPVDRACRAAWSVSDTGVEVRPGSRSARRPAAARSAWRRCRP